MISFDPSPETKAFIKDEIDSNREYVQFSHTSFEKLAISGTFTTLHGDLLLQGCRGNKLCDVSGSCILINEYLYLNSVNVLSYFINVVSS